MRQLRPTLPEVLIKTTVTHTVTYMLVGLLASTLLDYPHFFTGSALTVMMRPTTDPWVMAGPLFQPLRGALFGLAFYLLRESIFTRKNGWLSLWVVLVIIGVFGTFGPAPGSFEGAIYTVFPFSVHLRSLPEILVQPLLLAAILVFWVNYPQQRWLTWIMGIACGVALALPVLGLLVSQ